MNEAMRYPDAHEPWKRDIEDMLGLTVGQSTATAFSVTGEPYVSFCIGVKQEGREAPLWASSEADALKAFRTMVKEYAENVQGDCAGSVLYWRTTPMLKKRIVREKSLVGDFLEDVTLYTVYARLLVSASKPLECVA